MTALPLAATVLSKLGDALSFSFGMFWEILWALILGFGLSAVVQAVVSKGEMRRLLPDDSPRSIALAAGLGAASSSCSYAAVALARSLFRKGADFTAAMSFEFASTNLVIELGIIVALVLGWQFTVGEFVGGPLMIVLLALLFRLVLRRRLVEEARTQADRGLLGRMEGHAEMDMSVHQHGPYQGQPLMLFHFNQPLAGTLDNDQYWYVAEQIDPVTVETPTVFQARQVVAHFAASGTCIEIGWGNPNSNSRTLADVSVPASAHPPAGALTQWGETFKRYFGIPWVGQSP